MNPMIVRLALCVEWCLLPSLSMAQPEAGQPPRLSTTDHLPELDGTTRYVYKETDGVELSLFVFEPEDAGDAEPHAAIVFFFGGGWNAGSPKQFLEHCRYLAGRGMVAVTADYRVKSRQGVQAITCVQDGQDAIRWVRRSATRLNIDPERIVAAGGSAGGHVAACTGLIQGVDDQPEDTEVSPVPNAMALFNPALVLASVGDGNSERFTASNIDRLADRMGTDPQRLSPYHHVVPQSPPTIIFHGTGDKTVPFWTAEAFTQAMQQSGNRCELKAFENQPHGFFNFGRGDGSNYQATLEQLDTFLVDLGYLQEK